jgi:sec-independent protein translocase protein TatB
MIVVFVVVLVVFGPQKLPELARTFGKLMAEFRKASNDFKSAFEEEMRDLERQARIAELKKQVAEANAAADAATRISTSPAAPSSTPATTESTEAPENGAVPETVPRLDGGSAETEALTVTAATGEPAPAAETPPSHDRQQPA